MIYHEHPDEIGLDCGWVLLQTDADLVNQKRAMVLLKMALASQNLTTTSWAAFQLLHSVLDEFALPVIQVYSYSASHLCPIDGSE